MADDEIVRPTAPASLLEEFHPHIMLIPASEVLEWVNQQILSQDGQLHNPDHAHLIDANIRVMWASSAFSKGGARFSAKPRK